MVIKDPEVLKILETLGLGLPDRLAPLELEIQGPSDNHNLYEQKSGYFDLANVITSVLHELTLEERRFRGAGAVGVGMRYPIRIFDEKWLRSKIAKFELVGVINRVDQVALYPNTCGEFRLIYRLSYFEPRTNTYSRLPMTLMLRSSLPGNASSVTDSRRCKDLYLSRWTYPRPDLKVQLLSEKDLADYPFGKNFFVKSRLAAIERLNDLTCVGCHQGRATAGFHFLGVDAQNTHAFNALQFEGSGHFYLELKRRERYRKEPKRGWSLDLNVIFLMLLPLWEKRLKLETSVVCRHLPIFRIGSVQRA